MSNRPSGGDFFETGKGQGLGCITLFVVLLGVAGCSVNVRPTAESIANRLELRGDDGLQAFLERRGFAPRRFGKNHPYNETHKCVEKANSTAMLWVGGVDVVRVCHEIDTDQIEVLHFQTHGIAPVLYSYDPETGRVVCEDKTDIIKRCPE